MNGRQAVSDQRERVLVVAFQFPPLGGAGVQRTVRLTSNLRSHGYEPVILTIDEASIYRGDFVTDESFTSVVQDMKIIRTPSHEPVGLRRTLQRLRVYRAAWFLAFPLLWETAARWHKSATSAGIQAVEEYDIRLVYTTSGPFAALRVGRSIQQETGAAWIADLRDPYTDAYAWRWPSILHWKASRVWERRTLRYPDQVVVTTKATRDLFVKRKIVEPERIRVIHNSY